MQEIPSTVQSTIPSCIPPTIHYSPFTIHHSASPIPLSPFTIHYSQFTIPHSQFTIHNSLFKIPPPTPSRHASDWQNFHVCNRCLFRYSQGKTKWHCIRTFRNRLTRR